VSLRLCARLCSSLMRPFTYVCLVVYNRFCGFRVFIQWRLAFLLSLSFLVTTTVCIACSVTSTKGHRSIDLAPNRGKIMGWARCARRPGARPLAMPPLHDRTPGPLALRSARLGSPDSRPRALALLGFCPHLGSPSSRLPRAARLSDSRTNHDSFLAMAPRLQILYGARTVQC
jgi:hypothetical protein